MNWWSVRTCDCGEVVHQVEPGAPYLDRYGDRHPPHNEDVATPTESEAPPGHFRQPSLPLINYITPPGPDLRPYTVAPTEDSP